MYSGMVETFDCMEEITQPKQQTIPPLSTNFELNPRNGGEKGNGSAAYEFLGILPLGGRTPSMPFVGEMTNPKNGRGRGIRMPQR
jgi:hypothetical protein